MSDVGDFQPLSGDFEVVRGGGEARQVFEDGSRRKDEKKEDWSSDSRPVGADDKRQYAQFRVLGVAAQQSNGSC